MKKILILFVLLFAGTFAYAVEADDSVDEYIKKTFNADSSLPKLPKISPKSIESQNFLDNPTYKPTVTPKTDYPVTTKTSDIPKIPQKINVRTSKVAWGKKIAVKFDSNVSDSSKKGTRVNFSSLVPIYTKELTLPAGTKFYGTVVNSHSPQIFGNGGLVAIKVEYVEYNGRMSYCDGNIVNLNHKKVLFNNIKGKNGYTKGVSKVMRPAKTFYGKSLKVTKKMWNSPFFIIAPVTYLPGAVFLAGDAVAAPFIAVFHKGERSYIKRGSTATVKLVSPAYIEY